MQAYKAYLTIQDPKRVILPNVPFRSGQPVEVVVRARDDNSGTPVKELQTLFKTTQTLPQAQAISEADIAAEVAAYRRGRRTCLLTPTCV